MNNNKLMINIMNIMQKKYYILNNYKIHNQILKI